MTNNITPNFALLKEHKPMFFRLFSNADPDITLIKLRQLGKAFAQEIAARCGVKFDETTSQSYLLYKIHREIGFEPQIKALFQTLRIEGNETTLQFKIKAKREAHANEKKPIKKGIIKTL